VGKPAAQTGVLDMQLEPKTDQPALPTSESRAPAVVERDGDEFIRLLRELSIDDRVDPVKLAAIFNLKREVEADRAKLEYIMAFSAMSEELPVITKRGEIKNRAGQVQSKYALYEDIQRVIKPILRKYGFTVNHEQTPENSAEMVLTSFLMHRGGHAQRSTFRAKADTSGSKNDVQGLGSIAQYAKRYNVVGLLDLEMQGDDDDAQKGGALNQPPGFAEWLGEMQDAAMAGVKALTDKWQTSKKAYQDTLLAKDWEALKAGARTADKAAGRG
jgi:hypothetical protein